MQRTIVPVLLACCALASCGSDSSDRGATTGSASTSGSTSTKPTAPKRSKATVRALNEASKITTRIGFYCLASQEKLSTAAATRKANTDASRVIAIYRRSRNPELATATSIVMRQYAGHCPPADRVLKALPHLGA